MIKLAQPVDGINKGEIGKFCKLVSSPAPGKFGPLTIILLHCTALQTCQISFFTQPDL